MLRRHVLLATLSTVAAALTPRPSFARGRTPYGGRAQLHAPWPLAAIDPHRIDDAAAAFFGEALFDTLYARDADGAIVPSLAEADPVLEGAALRVPLRADVRFASGARLDARAAAGSLARSRASDGAAWLADIPVPHVTPDSLVFAMRDARRLVRALASPLVSVVPPRFAPERPDGTGPLRAEVQPWGLLLSRNASAATGPSFLDAIEIRHAPDLLTSLRAFEGGADDLGWLGSFLHEPRAGAKSFDAGVLGWAVLRTGRDAAAADTPGTAQALADGVPHAALAALVIGPPWGQGGSTWTGPPCDLVVRDDAPWLVELARAFSVAQSSPSHEVHCVPLPAAEIAQRRGSRAFTLMMDVARRAGPGPLGVILGLAAADDPVAAMSLARHPPRGELAPRVLTRTMRLGVVGEIKLQGGRAPDLVLPPSPWGGAGGGGAGVDWGGAFRARAAS